MDGGEDDSSMDEAGSGAGNKASSATTLSCAVSPTFSRSKEDKIENTMMMGEVAGEPVAAALSQDQESSWLDVDHLFHSDLELKEGMFQDKDQKMGNVKDGLWSGCIKADEAEDRSQGVHRIFDGAEGGSEDEDGLEQGRKSITVDPGISGSEANADVSYGEDGHNVGISGDAEGS